MKNIVISIIQFERKKLDKEYNLAAMRSFLRCVKKDTDIVLMPEGWLGPDILDMPSYIAVLEFLVQDLPHENCLLVAGAHYVSSGSRVLSRGAFVLPGELKAVYFEKQFPSHAIKERQFVARGGHLPVIDFKGIRIGGVVCVDLFYPEVVRGLALRNVKIVFNPANIPDCRMSLWHKLGVARACENTVFVAMANNTGTAYPDGRAVNGQSFIACPGGDSLLTCGNEPGVFQFTVDLEEIERVRERWQYLQDIVDERDRVERWYLW
ncbi:Nitrilase/cyanide hydratase and apolipoprotein N- acyltransferase [Desulfofarcimen acetoxidans DSM 771]|uniref:Nitrilase/cyanide hydratase and apolipoprotein N-acyltransferase n=1 Tax=Desulfofarcimen acetoxidans (strain ATCC 49208 / DSM 771 / KCTC 5769 / VKM B-1644 / 5575) TaxID=485916 RepID=C8VX16_DESAS|nr:carbon-nitrogen hydrolase family protein [Desulfofarcimen acetoxidans]ACV62592.1 Nitrilase/cyanide hydratase and apolipoprotein N- acyltransferase [Desulfofarcimen acetoxidans DSM 771]